MTKTFQFFRNLTKRRAALGLALVVVLLALPLIVFADNVQNDVTVGGNDTFTLGGSTTVSYRIVANNGDGQTGCNASDGSAASVVINTPAAVTASVNPISFTACDVFKSTVFTATTAGNYEITVAVTDSGTGTYNTNPAKFTLHVLAPPPPPDSTPPVITPNVSGTMGNNGWYVSDVSVSWTVNDPESTVTSKTGCDPTTINADTAGTTLTCTATSAGGTDSQSVTIKRDTTAPTISGSASPAANGNGWNNSDVTVSFSCGDALSGIASCGPNQTLLSEGAGQSVSGTAIDMAGNFATKSVGSINIDKTAPTISGNLDPAANGDGWNKTGVTVSFTCGDALSGLASCELPQTLSSEGAGQSASGTAVDKAGNSASYKVEPINIDMTIPTISGSAAPAANVYGWNNTPVTVSFTCGDALSDIASCGPNQTLSSEGAGQSVSGTAVDKAGNSDSTTVSQIKIDKTTPTVSVTGVSGGAQYPLGSVPAAGCSTSDGLSGVANDASVKVSGGNANGVGAFTATCSGGQDYAGNNADPVSVSYSVIYKWAGFFQPVDNDALNVAKAGSAIPTKFSLKGFQGFDIFAPGYPKSIKSDCLNGQFPDTIEETVTAGQSSLNYDATADQYNYVWKTDKAWAMTCRQLQVKLNDGTMYFANFQFKK